MRSMIGGLLVLLCSGCGGLVIGYAALPSATEKSIEKNDVLGTWQFEDSGRTVTIRFLPNGSFSQTNKDKDGVAKECQGGTWELRESHVHLNDYTPVGHAPFNSPVMYIDWYFVDTYNGGVVLFGGDDRDPDCYRELKKLP